MVLKKSNGETQSDRDGDGDGIPDLADRCPNTPNGVTVDPDGCLKKTTIAKVVNKADRGSAVNNHHSMKKHLAGNFESILFDFNRFELKPQYYAVLNEIALMLSQNPNTIVEIKGHADNVGTAEYNQILSEKRAETVKNYFVQKGVEENRLFPVGFGYTINQASNETETGRTLNRRVEMSIISDQKTLAYQQ
jgi:OOP family OmpA-OmpF porin